MEIIMKNTKYGTLTLLLCVSVSSIALAQPRNATPRGWDDLGSVTVDGRLGPAPGRPAPSGMDRDVRNYDLGGPVERVRLSAIGSDINCRSVNARFGNGRNNQIYQGMLRQGRPTEIDLPGDSRELVGLTFTCASLDQHDALIRISADVGRYRNNWTGGPNWGSSWSRMFNWDSQAMNRGSRAMNRDSQAMNQWQQIGSESFEGRGDAEMTNVGLRGRHVDSIALMPVNADARCGRVTARFDNGRTQTLNLPSSDLLRRGMYTRVDLPGNYRNLDSIALRCRATDAGRVTVNIYISH